MVPHFPRDMVPLLRCNTDAGELTLAEELRTDADGVLDAVLRCKICRAEYRIADGIALLLPGQLSSEARHEMRIRDDRHHCTNRVRSYLRPMVGDRSSPTSWKFPRICMNFKPRPQVLFWSLPAATVALRRSSLKPARGFSPSIFPLTPCGFLPSDYRPAPRLDASRRTSTNFISPAAPSIVLSL